MLLGAFTLGQSPLGSIPSIYDVNVVISLSGNATSVLTSDLFTESETAEFISGESVSLDTNSVGTFSELDLLLTGNSSLVSVESISVGIDVDVIGSSVEVFTGDIYSTTETGIELSGVFGLSSISDINVSSVLVRDITGNETVVDTGLYYPLLAELSTATISSDIGSISASINVDKELTSNSIQTNIGVIYSSTNVNLTSTSILSGIGSVFVSSDITQTGLSAIAYAGSVVASKVEIPVTPPITSGTDTTSSTVAPEILPAPNTNGFGLNVARLADLCTGHGCWPSRNNTTASTNVIINNRGAHRRGDLWAPHTCPTIPNTHSSILTAGSGTVFVNNLPLGRIGDPVACGSTVMTGSNNVFSG